MTFPLAHPAVRLTSLRIITPWNFPHLTTVNSVLPAILSGNAVLLKPAPQTPLSSLALAEILTEAGLSFLNMRDPNLVSWGGMIGAGRDLLRTAWFLTALPGVAIAAAVLSLNLVGDGLNEILNPRSEP